MNLFAGMRAVVSEHQVRLAGVKQQVSGFEGDGETLDRLTEVEGVPQEVVGRVHKQILRRRKNERNFKICQ